MNFIRENRDQNSTVGEFPDRLDGPEILRKRRFRLTQFYLASCGRWEHSKDQKGEESVDRS